MLPNRAKDIADGLGVASINLGTLGIVTLTDVEQWLRILCLVATISYTCFKFYRATHRARVR